jgi:cytochrome b6-f complex iron-sulfur subunit
MPPQPPGDAASPARRRLLQWLTRGFVSLWGLGSLWVVGAFLKPPRGSLGDRLIDVGPLSSLPVGQGRLVRHGRDPILVLRTSEDSLVGLSAVCTHLRCVLRWDGDRRALLCPCHDGAFDVNGNVVSGPPQSPLGRYRVESRLGRIYLHI